MGEATISKPKPPKPPDPVATAQAQGAANREAAVSQAWLNNANVNTPYGSVTYSQTGAAPDGTPRFTQTVTESPNQRTLRELEESQGIALGNLGLEQTGRVADILGQPYDPRRFDGAAATGGRLDVSGSLGGYNTDRFDPTRGSLSLDRFDPTSLGDFNLAGYDPSQVLGNFGDDVRQRSFGLATQGLEEQFGRGEESLRTRLANQGITQDSDAFRSEMSAFQRGKGNAYADAMLAADSNALAQRGQAAGELAQGAGLRGAERADLLDRMATGAGYGVAENADQLARLGQGYGQYTQDRGTQLAELLGERGTNLAEAQAQYGLDVQADQAARTNPLNEIIALANGVQTNPITPGAFQGGSIAAAPIAQSTYASANLANQAYQQQMSGQNAFWGSLAGLGGAALGSPWLFGRKGG